MLLHVHSRWKRSLWGWVGVSQGKPDLVFANASTTMFLSLLWRDLKEGSNVWLRSQGWAGRDPGVPYPQDFYMELLLLRSPMHRSHWRTKALHMPLGNSEGMAYPSLWDSLHTGHAPNQTKGWELPSLLPCLLSMDMHNDHQQQIHPLQKSQGTTEEESELFLDVSIRNSPPSWAPGLWHLPGSPLCPPMRPALKGHTFPLPCTPPCTQMYRL